MDRNDTHVRPMRRPRRPRRAVLFAATGAALPSLTARATGREHVGAHNTTWNPMGNSGSRGIHLTASATIDGGGRAPYTPPAYAPPIRPSPAPHAGGADTDAGAELELGGTAAPTSTLCAAATLNAATVSISSFSTLDVTGGTV